MKQVIVVRKDLKISVGKLIAQCCHASLEASEAAKRRSRRRWKKWVEEGAKKIVVKVDKLEELLKLEEEAKKQRIPHALIVDRGLTEVEPGTVTALAIGPWDDEEVDKITGNLKLFKY